MKLIRDDFMTKWFRCVEGCVAELSTSRTLDLEIRGSSLARRVVCLDEELHSILSFFTQVYKCVLATYCQGITL